MDDSESAMVKRDAKEDKAVLDDVMLWRPASSCRVNAVISDAGVLDNLDDAAAALSLLISSPLETGELDALYSHLEPCKRLLSRDPTIHSLLKIAHYSKEYNSVHSIAALQRQPKSDQVEQYLEGLGPLLRDLPNQETRISSWVPGETDSASEGLSAMASLDIAFFNGSIELLVDGLGSFQLDSILRERIKGVFNRKRRGNLLVNVSGSGKTRITFEGLCEDWGFYFICATDSNRLGSSDLPTVIQTLRLQLDGGLPFSRTPFEAPYAVGIVAISPRLLFKNYGRDIFYELSLRLEGYDDHYVEDQIEFLVSELQTLFGGYFHLFFVLDEAQVGCETLSNAFWADGQCPVLPEIMRAWDVHFPDQELSFVVAGTKVPREVFRTWSDFHWTSDTGGFDDESRHRSYIVTGHRPTDAEDLAAAEDWNRERPDSQVARVLCDPLERQPLLRTTFQAVLAHYLVIPQRPLPFDTDRTDVVSRAFGRFIDTEMKQIVVDEPALLVSTAEWFCQRPKATYDDVNGHVEAPHTAFTVLARHPPTDSKIFARVLAFYFTRAFEGGCALPQVFSFPHKPVPSWANQKAELVSLSADGYSVIGYGGPSLPEKSLGVNPAALSGISAWLDGTDSAAFCLPRSLGPDLLFALRLADKSFVRVILHASVTQTLLEDDEFKVIVKRLDNGNLFNDEKPEADGSERDALTARLGDSIQGQKTHILRVIASFPAKTNMKTATPKRNKNLANLNTGHFERVMAGIPVVETRCRKGICPGTRCTNCSPSSAEEEGKPSCGRQHR
ncbi:hypothetical protein DFH09DRAFT_1270572 [Mycena vulgaris]|nr:hypothetical protein DFH09DRAFT_1270572 [Mycena vulgaris]